MRRWRRARHRTGATALDAALSELCQPPLDILFVHSSLSKCGLIEGGAATVIETLRKLCDTLVLPTHSYCYPSDPAGLGSVFDARHTPSSVGAISDWFWRQPGVVRSLHPSHSLAALGRDAAALCAGHEECATPCGEDTPYEKLLDRDAAVLMFGCTLNTYTLFHTSEALFGCAYLYCPLPVAMQLRDTHGQVRQMKMKRQDMTVPRRFAEMRAELEEAGLLRSRPLGSGELLCLPNAKSVHAYVMQKFAIDPDYLVKKS